MTWAEVSLTTTDFVGASDEQNDYVATDYVVSDYLSGSVIWVEVDNTSTTWT